MRDEDILRLYGVASVNAARDSLTGLTVYHRKGMFHIREGESQLVSNSIIRAESQGWHYNLSIVEDAAYSERLFDDWNLAYLPEDPASLTKGAHLLDLETMRDNPKLAKANQNLTFSTFLDVFLGNVEHDVKQSRVRHHGLGYQSKPQFIKSINEGVAQQA
jgi:hypothetical protein